MSLKSFIAQSGQSINDLAYMAYGDFGAIFKLLGENPNINISSNNFEGITINYTPDANSTFAKQVLTGKIIATAWQDNTGATDYLEQENGFDFELESGTGKIELE